MANRRLGSGCRVFTNPGYCNPLDNDFRGSHSVRGISGDVLSRGEKWVWPWDREGVVYGSIQHLGTEVGRMFDQIL